jgi:RimJ/RimL family protein N-acetyltransferase
MTHLETEHLYLRPLTADDAAFFLELANEPSWLAYIPDKGLRTVAAAREYIVREPLALQARVGYSPYAVVARARGAAEGEPIGICGLVKRDELEDPDIAFAFLGRHCHQGHGFEAATRVLEHAREDLGLRRVVAITDWGNQPSRKLLEKLGFALEGGRVLGDEDGDEELAYYAIALG